MASYRRQVRHAMRTLLKKIEPFVEDSESPEYLQVLSQERARFAKYAEQMPAMRDFIHWLWSTPREPVDWFFGGHWIRTCDAKA